MLSESQKERVTKAIQSFNSLTHYPRNPEKEILEISNTIQSAIDKHKLKVSTIEDNEDYQKSLQNFVEKNVQYIEAISRSRWACPPWSVTGRANYRGNPDKANRIEERARDNLNLSSTVLDKVFSRIYEATLPPKIDRDASKLANLEKMQTMMVEANKLLRKHKDNVENAVPHLINLGFTGVQAAELLKPDYMGRVGFAPFMLTNNKARIKTLKQSVEKEEKRLSEESKEISTEAVKVVDSPEENRIQLFFNGKPEDAERQRLKQNGFKWSPTRGCWQRFRTIDTKVKIKQLYGIEI